MRLKISRRLSRIGKAALLTGFLGSVIGYLAFHTVLPSLSVPATGETSLLPVVGALFASAVLAGLLTDHLGLAILEVFAAIPVGATVASAVALSPLLTGILVAESSGIVIFVLRLGLPVFLFALVIDIIGIVLGMATQEMIGRGAGYGLERPRHK